jgi:hypothetical protein
MTSSYWRNKRFIAGRILIANLQILFELRIS